MLAIACAQLPAERTRDVQQKAAFYTHDFERKYRELYGSAAQRLLRDIPADRLTPQAKARKDELNREFPPKPTGPTWEKLAGLSDDHGLLRSALSPAGRVSAGNTSARCLN